MNWRKPFERETGTKDGRRWEAGRSDEAIFRIGLAFTGNIF